MDTDQEQHWITCFRQVLSQVSAGQFVILLEDKDIHTNYEMYIIAISLLRG